MSEVAQELELILEQTPDFPQRPAPALLSLLPANRRGSAPLLTEIPVEKFRREMVLPEIIES